MCGVTLANMGDLSVTTLSISKVSGLCCRKADLESCDSIVGHQRACRTRGATAVLIRRDTHEV